MTIYTRFIALGDSFTEGMQDYVVDGQYRGWADRVADVLTTQSTDFTYLNLAIRGKLVTQVSEDQVPLAIPFITGKETLVSFHAGANDVLRPGYRPENVFPAESRHSALNPLEKLISTILNSVPKHPHTWWLCKFFAGGIRLFTS